MAIIRNELERKLRRRGFLFIHNKLSQTIEGTRTNEEIREAYLHNPDYKNYITDVYVADWALDMSSEPKSLTSGGYKGIYFKYRRGIRKRFGFSAIDSLI